jgi:hypothetical protein
MKLCQCYLRHRVSVYKLLSSPLHPPISPLSNYKLQLPFTQVTLSPDQDHMAFTWLFQNAFLLDARTTRTQYIVFTLFITT